MITQNQYKTTAMIFAVLLLNVSSYADISAESAANGTILVKNVWVDVPLSQILRDISVENGVLIATCPHVSDPLISLDAGKGKPLEECLNDLIAGQGLFVHKKGPKFYLVVCGDPGCPSTVETVTSYPLYLKYITAKHLKDSLPKSLQQYVNTGSRDNEALIYAVPDITKHITEIIQKLDVPQEQVMLEVLVVDLWEGTSDEFGLDWEILSPHTSFSMASGALGFTGLASYTSVAASRLVELSLTLRALVEENRASIRSRPRVATLNGEKAKIDISLDEYYTIATDLYGTSLRTELEVIKSGVTLEITPHIGDGGNITVDVLTEVSDVASRRNSSGSSSGSNTDLPVIRRRKADTRVRVKEGDAIVIGGLIEEQESTNHKRVPLAGDIPIIGGLFKSKEDSTIKKEVMIFITPQLIREGEAAFSDRHTLIDEPNEIGKLRTTDFLARNENNKKIHNTDEEIKSLNEVVNLLDDKKQPNNIPHEINDADLSGYRNLLEIDQESKMLQEVITLLDVKNEQMYPITESLKSKNEASCGVIGK